MNINSVKFFTPSFNGKNNKCEVQFSQVPPQSSQSPSQDCVCSKDVSDCLKCQFDVENLFEKMQRGSEKQLSVKIKTPNNPAFKEYLSQDDSDEQIMKTLLDPQKPDGSRIIYEPSSLKKNNPPLFGIYKKLQTASSEQREDYINDLNILLNAKVNERKLNFDEMNFILRAMKRGREDEYLKEAMFNGHPQLSASNVKSLIVDMSIARELLLDGDKNEYVSTLYDD